MQQLGVIPQKVIALDVGERRIGVALCDMKSRLPHPLSAILNGPTVAKDIQALIAEHAADALVVGLPRGLEGQETRQTAAVRLFVEVTVAPAVSVPIYWQDEAATSLQAEAELRQSGRHYKKGDVDSLSATYILEDFVREQTQGQA